MFCTGYGEIIGNLCIKITDLRRRNGNLRLRKMDAGIGMVSGLAVRLDAEPQDQPGWSRLIRAYFVLGRTAEAQEALQRARSIFSEQPDKLAALNSQVPPQLGAQE